MAGPLDLLKPRVRKDVEEVTIRLPDGTIKKVTRAALEAKQPTKGGKQ